MAKLHQSSSSHSAESTKSFCICEGRKTQTTGWKMYAGSLSVSCICEGKRLLDGTCVPVLTKQTFTFKRIWHINASTQQSFPVSHFQCSRMLFTPLQAVEGMRSFLLHCLYLPPFLTSQTSLSSWYLFLVASSSPHSKIKHVSISVELCRSTLPPPSRHVSSVPGRFLWPSSAAEFLWRLRTAAARCVPLLLPTWICQTSFGRRASARTKLKHTVNDDVKYLGDIFQLSEICYLSEHAWWLQRT